MPTLLQSTLSVASIGLPSGVSSWTLIGQADTTVASGLASLCGDASTFCFQPPGGATYKFSGFGAGAAIFPGSFAFGGGATLGSSSNLAQLSGAVFTGAVSAPSASISGTITAAAVTNGCSGVSAAMTGGTVVVTASCITGSRPITLNHADAAGSLGILSYTESAGEIVITSNSSTDTSTVTWVQN